MKLSRTLVTSLALTSMSVVASSAFAGPPVEVTFKNQADQAAEYIRSTNNETQTYQNAQPKPDSTVGAGESDTYAVQSTLSPDVNYAVVHYKAGQKECAFSTTYVNIGITGTTPTYNEDAVSKGGNARCTATITSVNPSTGAWAVDFMMR